MANNKKIKKPVGDKQISIVEQITEELPIESIVEELSLVDEPIIEAQEFRFEKNYFPDGYNKLIIIPIDELPEPILEEPIAPVKVGRTVTSLSRNEYSIFARTGKMPE